jgi:ribosomal protein L11 methyltransferase
MKWIEVKVVIDAKEPQWMAEWIADLFFDQGVKGVVIDDPNLEPAEGWGKDAVPLPTRHAVTGYFPDTPQTAKRCRALEGGIKKLEKQKGASLAIELRRLDEEDWAECWKEFFWPEKVGHRLVVKPSWRPYAAVADEIVLTIDPGMAFGTGTHPTTALCLAAIENYLSPGDRFLDLGTGSGILMIAAARLGAARLCGIDSDEVAVTVARKNLLLNQVPQIRWTLVTGHLADPVKETYQVVAANILSEVILVLLDDVRRVLADGGILILSGIIQKNSAAVEQKLRTLGFEILEIGEREEWVCIVARRVCVTPQRGNQSFPSTAH